MTSTTIQTPQTQTPQPESPKTRSPKSQTARLEPAGTAAEQTDRRLTGILRALIAVPALALAGYLGWLAFLNVCYPVRPLLGMSGYDPHAWGGPTYAGVWAVHAAAGLAMLAAVVLLVRPFIPRRSR